MKRIAAITTVRNDEFFLRKWVKYYGEQLGEENLYVFLDGKDQKIPSWCPNVNVEAIDKLPGKIVEMEKIRAAFMSSQAARLLETYDMVIGTDGDEFIIVDPALGMTLPEYLSTLPDYPCYSGLGIDVGQNTNCEGVINEDELLLNQREYALLDTRYTKASILAKPIDWGSGFHRVRKYNYHIVKDLYLFHFGSFDLKKIEDRFKDKERTTAKRHVAKRARTITIVSKAKIRSWEKWVPLARKIQTCIRPPYAWNKPGMFKMHIVVRIPERFRNLV